MSAGLAGPGRFHEDADVGEIHSIEFRYASLPQGHTINDHGML